MDKIYAVTVSHSVYELDLDPSHKNPWPIVVKISGPKNGLKIGDQLLNGHFIGIGTNIVLFDGLHGGISRPDEVNIVNHGGHTSQVVGLFKKKISATYCSRKMDLKPYDPRWKKETLTIMKEIGDDHPMIRFSSALAMELAQL